MNFLSILRLVFSCRLGYFVNSVLPLIYTTALRMELSVNGHNSSSGSEGLPQNKFYYLEPRFECPICLTCLKSPFITSCGHKFCKECIQQWLKKDGGTCPIDSEKLCLEKDIFPDNYTKREISQQIVTCPFPDCSKALPLLEAEKHMFISHEDEEMSSSDKKLCPFGKIGCKYELESQSQVMNHLQQFMSHHLLLLVNAHDRLSLMMQSSGQSEEAHFWDADKLGLSPSSLTKTLYEKIITLEQADYEKNIILNGMKSQIQNMAEQGEKIDSSRINNGVLLWKITNASQTLRSMSSDSSIKLFSEGFYTSYYGYKFCCRINGNTMDPSVLSLNVHLMKSAYDYSLAWPFCGRISVTLVHPTCTDASLRDVMVSNPTVDAFKRPRTDVSLRGFGYADFVRFADLLDKGYIDPTDCLTIRVEIITV